MYLSIYLSIDLPTYLPIYISIYWSIDLSIYLCIYASMYLCVYVSMYLCIYVSMHVCMHAWCMYVCMCESDVPLYMSVYWLQGDLFRVSQWSTRDRLQHGSLLLGAVQLGSWAKRTIGIAVPWHAERWLYTWGLCTSLLLYPHSHPPRMTDFISHAQESRLKVPFTAFTLIELWRVRNFYRGLLRLHLSIQIK